MRWKVALSSHFTCNGALSLFVSGSYRRHPSVVHMAKIAKDSSLERCTWGEGHLMPIWLVATDKGKILDLTDKS